MGTKMHQRKAYDEDFTIRFLDEGRDEPGQFLVRYQSLRTRRRNADTGKVGEVKYGVGASPAQNHGLLSFLRCH